MIEPTDDEIGEQLNHCSISADSGKSAYPGMTYEQGVDAAIMWMTGNSDEPPVSPGDLFTDED